MGCTVRAIPHGPLPRDLVRMVGATLREHLRITARPAHARFRLLRLRLHHTDDRTVDAVIAVLLGAKHGNEDLSRHPHGRVASRFNHNCFREQA